MRAYRAFIAALLILIPTASRAKLLQIGAFRKTPLEHLHTSCDKIIKRGYEVRVYTKGDLKRLIVVVPKGKDQEFQSEFGLKGFPVSESSLKKAGFKLAKVWGAPPKKESKQGKPEENAKRRPIINSLESIKIKDDSIYLYGRMPWEYVETERLQNPERIVIHLFNAKNESGITEMLVTPIPCISKIRVNYDYINKDTQIILYPVGKVSVKLSRMGRLVRVYTESIRPQKSEKASVELGKNQKVSLEFKDADIRDVIRILADISGLNFVVDPEVKGTVTIRLRNVPWQKALDVILKVNGLGMIDEGDGIIRIGPVSKINAELSKRARMKKVMQEVAPLYTEIFSLNYASASEVKSLVESILKGSGAKGEKVEIINRLNALLVKATREDLEKIRKLIKRVDTPIPQVQISARLVEITTDFSRDLGIQWGFMWTQSSTEYNFPHSFGIGGAVGTSGGATSTVSSAFSQVSGWSPGFGGYVVDLPAGVTTGEGGAIAAALLNKKQTFGIDLRLTAMENNGYAKVISNPKVITMDNKEAEISQGYEIPYATVSESGTQTEFKEATLKLKVKPHITSGGDVILDIEVTKDSPDFTHTTPDGVPIQKRAVKTRVRMKNGDTLVIGGIYELNKYSSKKGVPGLMRVPLLNWLFEYNSKSEQKRELLIFITPTIVKGHQPAETSSSQGE